ncbi:hypothetical protein G9A89_010665 [Geosiphon pyriformis]|nr:hypothetical protein G9A89_010665 [Geosiphon pyriformis]
MTIPIEVTLKGLQDQVVELREIVAGIQSVAPRSSSTDTVKNELKLQEETPFENNNNNNTPSSNALLAENKKLKYRIDILLRVLDAKDQEIMNLKKCNNQLPT